MTDMPTREEGWGADLEPARRPAVPKEKPSSVQNVRGNDVPERMVPQVRIHMSVEHPDLTPVFGTSCPPRGISGALRDVAYQYSEGRLAHWMTLMLADRVDVLEGMVEDLARGHVPDFFGEEGYDADLRKSRRRRDLMIAGGVLGTVAAAILLSGRRNHPLTSRPTTSSPTANR